MTLTIDDTKWGWLEAKDGDPAENLMLKVNEYLDACGRDCCADVDAELTKHLAALDLAAKETLLALVKGE